MAEKPTYKELLDKICELEEKDRMQRSLTENSSDLLYRTDLQGRVIYISRSVFDLAGYTMTEAIGIKMAEEVYLHPKEREIFLEKLRAKGQVTNFEAQLKRKDGSIWWASTNAHFFKDKDGNIAGVEGITRDISDIKSAQENQRNLIAELQDAVTKIQTLSGLLPICSSCKKIRDDKGYWNQIETFIDKHSDATFSHGICPECSDKLYGDQNWYSGLKNDNSKNKK